MERSEFNRFMAVFGKLDFEQKLNHLGKIFEEFPLREVQIPGHSGPLDDIFTELVMENDLVVDELTTREQKEEFRLIRKVIFKTRVLNQYIYGPICEVIRTTSKTKLIESLERIFDSNPHINTRRKESLLIALSYFHSREDFAFIHIVTPHIEGVLRDINYSVLETSYDLKNSGRSMDELLFTKLINELEKQTTMKEPLVQRIKAVFNNRKGYNIRNKIAHGLLMEEDCTQEISNLLFCLLIEICLQDIQPKV